MVEILVLTSSDQLLFILKLYLSFHTTIYLVWKELFKCLDDVLSNVWSAYLKINLTTSTLSSCTCSFEGQATLNEYL
jgi:hypothetical protein